MFRQCDALPKRGLCDMLFCVRNPFPHIPAIPCFLRAAAPSTSSALCLHHAHPFVAAEEKNHSHSENPRVWSPKSPLSARSLRCLRAAVDFTSSALCLHHAHSFIAAAEKKLVSCREAGVCSRSCGFTCIFSALVIALQKTSLIFNTSAMTPCFPSPGNS